MTATRRLSYRAWRQPLGEVMPLAFLPTVLDMTREAVSRMVARQELNVYTFRGDDGRVYRMVRVEDVRKLKQNPLTLKGLARALDRMVRQQAMPESAPTRGLRRAA